jgi:hypothetical protein
MYQQRYWYIETMIVAVDAGAREEEHRLHMRRGVIAR